MVKVYIDLDNVLTNFRQAVKDIGVESGLFENASREDKQRMNKAIEEAGKDFWANMPWLRDGKRLFKALEKYKPVILSAPGYFSLSKEGKRIWVRDNLPGVTLICEDNKAKFAEPNAILIDDRLCNVVAWRQAGGIAIHHKDADSTLREFHKILSEIQLQQVSRVVCSYIKKFYE